MRYPSKPRSERHVVGQNLPKVDAMRKVIGDEIFADDVILPRMLHAKMLRSPHPHAKIRSIDTSPALAMDGVHGVITAADFGDVTYGILPVSQDEEALVRDHARYVGDPIACVAAVSEEIAEAASEAIVVDWEILDPIMSTTEALERGDLRIHEYGPEGNIHKMVALEFGDLDDGFARADHIREDVFFFEGNTHLAMEQHASVARWEPGTVDATGGDAGGKLTLWSSTQTPHYVHRAMAKVLELAPSQIRIVACPNGGGFGGKSDPFNHEMCVARLAMLTGRPVKIALTREEVFYCHRGRHPVQMWVRTGFRKDGRILAMHFRSMLDGGAYGSYGVASTYYTGALQTVTYDVENYKFEGIRLFTNKPACGPKRGHGTPQPRFAVECQLDKAAADLGLDPVSIRRPHLVPAHSITCNYLKITTTGLAECLDEVVQRSGFLDKHGKMPPGKGIGLACSSYISGAGLPIYWNKMPHSGVVTKIDRGGGVAIFCGSTDIGQGSDSVLAYVVAEILGVRVRDCQVFTADTDLTPVDLGSYSSRVTLMTGNAAIESATKLRDQLFEVAAEMLECEPADLDARDCWIFKKTAPTDRVPFVEVANVAEARFGTLASVGSYRPPRSPGRHRGAGVGPSPAYSYQACAIELTVDMDTGIPTIDHIWIAHDGGTCLNPLLVVGQVEGSVYMGLGEAMMEEMVYRKGVHKIPSLLDYKSPTSLEMPPTTTILVETEDPEGPFGGKECGQGPLLPIPPAYNNALHDAIGVRFDETPVGPDKILLGIHGSADRVGPKSFPDVDWKPPIRVELPDMDVLEEQVR